ncbi:MAG: thiol-disulfide oxidoreductase DCC family protein [Elainellaceae cyanobacterium]
MNVATPIPHINAHDKVILFDGVCRFCSGWSNFILEQDKAKKFKLAPLQSPAGQDILAHFNLPTDRFDSMVYVENNQLYQRSDAALNIAKHLPIPWNGLSYFEGVPKELRDWFYNQIASNRYDWFGKYDECVLPTPDHQERFLDDA